MIDKNHLGINEMIIEINQDKTAVVALTSDLLSYNGMDIPLQKTTSEKFLCKICFFEGN